MVEIDLTLVLKTLSDVGKMRSMTTTNLLCIRVGILKLSKKVSVASCSCENYSWRRSCMQSLRLAYQHVQ